ncbi:hypothetical protein H1Q78_17985 [Cellulosimicrobium cellulans]|uniref:hypothetical protein n=1 Tax=Cellulosimicrobium cellulans TaxID=1710 RepID=UPI001EDADC2E|nr:hypothetical protein [Cellulosimicrobium cellulans]UKJ63505.1 hypothetical protein H1Q78_17985 [Cellulosimicrobium cellulans]
MNNRFRPTTPVVPDLGALERRVGNGKRLPETDRGAMNAVVRHGTPEDAARARTILARDERIRAAEARDRADDAGKGLL